MRVLFIAYIVAVIGMVTSLDSHAQYGYDSFGGGFGQQQSCGPELTANYNNGSGGSSFNSFGGGGAQGQESYSVGIKWSMDRQCKQRQEAQIAVQRHKAHAAEIDTLNDKIATCSRFDPMTAPPSIKRFCGDLVGVQVRAPVAQPAQRYTYPQ